jgi:segregation and condensation protein B
MPLPPLKMILEAALLAAAEPLSVERLLALFEEGQRPAREAVRAALQELARDYEGRGVELVEVASGFRVQVRQAFAPWVSRLWEERAARYSRALLETLALIAYRQPITRGEIEEVRGVSVSSTLVKTLLERGWIKVLGHREVPGRPALYGTTRAFLDYFNLKSLGELPPLAELRDLDAIGAELERRQTSTEPTSGTLLLE